MHNPTGVHSILGAGRFGCPAAGCVLAAALALHFGSVGAQAQRVEFVAQIYCTGPPCPGIPTGYAEPGPEDGQITVTWALGSDGAAVANWHVVHLGSDAAFGTWYGPLGTTLRTYVFEGLDENQTYSVGVRAVAHSPPSDTGIRINMGWAHHVSAKVGATTRVPVPQPQPEPGPEPEPEPPASDCTLVAPYWTGPTGGFTVRPALGRTSVSLTCGGRTTEYMAEDGLVTRLVESSCRGTGLELTGAAPGGWYWQHGDRNAAVAPLVCSEALGGPPAVVPGGITADATDDGTLIRHDTARLIGIVPHLAGNDCSEYVTPYWQGDGGVVVRPAEGRETVRVRVQCGRTYSTMTPSAGEDGVIAELVRKSYCTDDEGGPRQGRLTVTGAAPGGWYWIRGGANAAVGPLMCVDLLGGPGAVDPGGVNSRATEDGTHVEHEINRLIGVVPHLSPNAGDD